MIEFYGGYQVYSESGIDLTLLRENLKRTFPQRLENACRSAAFVEELDRSRLKQSSQFPGNDGVRPMFDPAGLLKHLSDHRIEFVVVGGLAMIAQGSAYITRDLDICYQRGSGNLSALATALAPLHPYLRGAPPGLPFRLDAPTLQSGLNFTLTTDLGDLDLLGEVAGVGAYEQVFASSIERDMAGIKVRVLSLDGLIAAKKAAGRPKDRNHLLELEELKKLRDATP